jgi:hypothetical protein
LFCGTARAAALLFLCVFWGNAVCNLKYVALFLCCVCVSVCALEQHNCCESFTSCQLPLGLGWIFMWVDIREFICVFYEFLTTSSVSLQAYLRLWIVWKLNLRPTDLKLKVSLSSLPFEIFAYFAVFTLVFVCWYRGNDLQMSIGGLCREKFTFFCEKFSFWSY